MLPHADALFAQSQLTQPITAKLTPVIEPLLAFGRLTEELELHLFKLASAKNEIPRSDLVAKSLAYLGDAQRQLGPGGSQYVAEIDEDALSRFRPQIDDRLRILSDTLERFEHHVEVANIRKVAGLALRAQDTLLPDECRKLVVGPAVSIDLLPLRSPPVSDQLVGPKARAAGPAVGERIRETAQVPGDLPHPGVHQYCRIHSHIVR